MNTETITVNIKESTTEKYAITNEPKTLEEFAAKYDTFTKEQIIQFHFLRTRTVKAFIQRYENAVEVIDVIADEVEVSDKGFYLYGLVNGETPIVEKIKEFVSRSGDKAKMKKRIDELENENAVLRSLLGKG